MQNKWLVSQTLKTEDEKKVLLFSVPTTVHEEWVLQFFRITFFYKTINYPRTGTVSYSSVCKRHARHHGLFNVGTQNYLSNDHYYSIHYKLS